MRSMAALFFVAFTAAAPAAAQAPQAYAPARVTADDYARAETFMSYEVDPLVSGASVRPTWLPDGRFWYRNQIPAEATSSCSSTRPRAPARAPSTTSAWRPTLSKAADAEYAAFDLPFTHVRVLGRRHGRFRSTSATGAGRATSEARRAPGRRQAKDAAPPDSVTSPDGTHAAFIRDDNLWVRDLATGRDTALTTDGVKDFGYATNNAGWTKSPRPVLLWSPDSRRIATFQHDARGIGDMYLVRTKVGHPELEQWEYPLPGDDGDLPHPARRRSTSTARRSSGSRCRPTRTARASATTWYCGGTLRRRRVEPRRLEAVLSSPPSRDHKHETLRVADPATGTVRDILEEREPRRSSRPASTWSNWQALPASNELIWWSERDNWGHLYLYDLATGRLKNPITTGDWPVLQVLKVDEKARTI